MLTIEQKQIRLGLFCGSENYKLMGAKGLGQTGETYILEKAAEFLTGQPAKPEFNAASTDWGNKYEPDAKLHFESASGIKILEASTLENGLICGTPDGLLDGIQTGIEIKCPYDSTNHLKNLLIENQDQLKDVRKEYYWQIISYMWLTGFKSWKFCSYDPRFSDEKRMLIINVSMNEADLKLLQDRVKQAKEIFDSIIKALAA